MDILVVLVVFVCCLAQSQSSRAIQDAFFVKPGGQTTSFKKELDDYTCTFTYQAQGGTHEQWQMIMEKSDDGRSLMCSFARGQTSYLFFQTFSATVSGPGISLQEIRAINTGSTPLDVSEYKMDSKTNTLSDVPGKFKNHLEEVTLMASLEKQEL